MKNVILFLTFLVSIHYSLSQTRVVGTDYTSFRIEQENDTIDFVIADTVLNVKKPLLLFCQGSLPVPLFVDFGNNRIAPLQFGNFDLENMKKHYHVVVISMPKTPIVPKIEELSEEYFFIGNSGRRNPTDEFSLADYLENYVRRANTVIERSEERRVGK